MLTGIVILAALAVTTLCRIDYGRGLDKATIMQNDILVYYMNEVFNLSQARPPISFTANHGWIRDYKTVLNKMEYPFPYHTVNAFEYINNQTFAVVLDNRNVIIQTVDLEGLTFTTSIAFTYRLLGAQIRCDDVEIYYPEGLIFIGCWSTVSGQGIEPGPIFLVVVDMHDTTNYNVITVPQTDGFNLQTRLRLGLWPLSQGSGSQDVFVFLWDQTASGTNQFNTQWTRVFSGVETGQPKYAGLVNITQGFPQLRTLYDMFLFNNQILISSSILGKANIQFTACNYYETNSSFFCDTTYTKSTNFSYGYVGLTLGGRYIEYNIQATHYRSCEVTQNFSSPGWITNTCDNYYDFPSFPGGCFVVAVEDNWSSKLMTWVHPDGGYAGASFHSRELNMSWREEDINAVIIGNRLYLASPSEFIVRKLTYTSLLLNSTLLPNTETQVTVTATDADGSLNEYGDYTVMFTALDEVYYQEDKSLPEIDIYAGTSFYFPMAEDEYFGNNLNFTPYFRWNNDSNPFLGYKTYTTFPVNIVFVFKAQGLPQFEEISFTDSHAVAKDKNDRIFLFACGASDIDQARCNELNNIVVEDDDKLQLTTLELMGFVFSWIKNKIRTKIIIWNSMTNEYFTTSYAGPADDVHATVINNRLYIFTAYQSDSIVYVKTWSPVNPKNFQDRTPLSVNNSFYAVFCPVDVYDTFNGTAGYIEVLSVCTYASPPDQRVIRYNALNLEMQGYHPIDLDIANPTICAIGDSYIFASLYKKIVVGKSMVSDETKFYFYLDQFASVKSLVGVNCVEKSGIVVIHFIDQYNRLGYFTLWGDSKIQANKRVHSVTTGLAAGTTYMQSFSVKGVVMHAIYSGEGSYSYMMSLTKAPVIKVDVGFSNDPYITGLMTLSIRNGGGGGASATAGITIRHMNRTITVVSKNNKTIPGNNFNLEDYITIYGHVFNGALADERIDSSTSIHLLQRNTRTYKFFPPLVDQVIFNHLEAHGDYMIALHTDLSYASFFTIFVNLTNQGVIQPRSGVQAFDFAPSNGGRALIAYGSSINSGNQLSFMLINQGYIVNEIFVPTGMLYSKLRFAQYDQNDGFMLFAWSAVSNSVDVFAVTIKSLSIQPTKIFSIPSVVDFDVTDPGSRVNFYYIGPEANVLSVASWKKTTPTGGPSFVYDIDIQGTHKYWFRTVSCVNELPESSSCVINIMGSHMYEAIIPNGQGTAQVNFISKYGNYDGKFIYIDENFIAMRGVTNTPPLSYSFLVWKRPSKGGDGNLYLGENIIGESLPGQIESGFTPFSLITYKGNSVLFTGSHDVMEPLIFWKIGTYGITSAITNSNDLNSIYVDFMAYGSMAQTESIGALTNQVPGGDDKPTKKVNVWMIVAIALGSVILIGIFAFAIMILKGKTAEADVGSGSHYQTIGPDANRLGRGTVNTTPAQPAGQQNNEDLRKPFAEDA